MKKILIVVTLVLTVVLFAAQKKAPDDLDPLKVAGDTHKLAFENAFVRVLDVRLPPGKLEPMHRHPHGLSIYFQDWDAQVTVRGKTPVTNPRKAGTFAWSEAVVHEVRNASKVEAHILRIELKF